MKVVIEATPAEIVKTLELLEGRENNVATADRVCSMLAGKLDQVTRAISGTGNHDCYFGAQSSYSIGSQSHCVGQSAMGVGQAVMAGGTEYEK